MPPSRKANATPSAAKGPATRIQAPGKRRIPNHAAAMAIAVIIVRMWYWRLCLRARSRETSSAVSAGCSSRTLTAQSLLFHRKNRWFCVLVTDLVNWLGFAPPGVEAVRSIEDESGNVPHVAIGVHDSGRDPDGHRVRLTHGFDQPAALGWAP